MSKLFEIIKKNGFWYPAFTWIIKKIYRISSIGYNLNKYFNRRKKGGRWVSEFYQFIWIAIGILWINYINQPILSGWYFVNIGICIALYKPLEIILFTLDWLFVQEREPVESYSRSLAGFLLNMVEIGLFFSIVYILSDSVSPYGSARAVAKVNIIAVFTLEPVDFIDKTKLISMLTTIQIVLSWFLYVVILGNVIGNIRRGEMADYTQGKTKKKP